MVDPATTAIAAFFAGKAAENALKRVVDDLYNSASDGLKTAIRNAVASRHISTLVEKLGSVRLVKTIWQVDREVDLTAFYHPTRINVGEKRKVITCLKDTGYKGNIIFEGLVGQGKSIFLRYLTCSELVAGQRVPLFLEFRRLSGARPLETAILSRLDDLGFTATTGLLEYLASTGRLVLMLDAFDEIAEDMSTIVVNELESMIQRFPKLQVIVTTRPDTDICHCPQFRIFRLSYVTQAEIPEVVTRLTDDPEVAQNLLAAIRKARALGDALATPLMITLLVMTYRAHGAIPDSLAGFYEALVPLLLARHDQSKPGFVRKKACGLNDHRIRRIFEAFCFTTKKRCTKPSMSHRVACDAAREAIEVSREQCDEAAFVKDIVKVTCLLLEEGGELSFLHRSVQEFGCAAFVQHATEEFAQAFYKQMLAGKWMNWQVELRFLSDIDSHRFTKYFVIPDLEKAISRLFHQAPTDVKGASNQVIERLLSRFKTNCTDGKDVFYVYEHGPSLEWCLYRKWTSPSRMIREILTGVGKEAVLELAKSRGLQPSKGIQFSVVDLWKAGKTSAGLIEGARSLAMEVVSEWRTACSYLQQIEEREKSLILDI